MPLYALGLNHRTAPIEVRETVAFPLESQRQALSALQATSGAQEVVLVSTCNRSEIYLAGADAAVMSRATDWLRQVSTANKPVDIASHLYLLQDSAVTRHAFRVACGLDSMVLGEPQILGQVKLAVKMAGESGTLGSLLNQLFQQTFAVAKQVRSETAIGAASVSMAAAALKLAQQLFGDLRDTTLLLIGVGDMIELAATHFAAQHPRRIVIANRTLERGQALAERFGAQAQAITLKEVPERIHEFDALITSTASTLPIIGKGMIERALKLRKHRPMFMVDLAVPRDIEPEVSDLDDVFLYTLDTLGTIIQQNAEKREAAVREADTIIDRRVAEFMARLNARASVPVIQQLRGKAEQYRQTELVRAQKLLAKGEDPQKVLESLSQGLTNKFLHHPLQALNRAEDSERDELAKTLARLYPDSDTDQ